MTETCERIDSTYKEKKGVGSIVSTVNLIYGSY